MTAISRLFTPAFTPTEAFVIAADGRKRDSEAHSIVDDRTQKIFEIPGMQIGYALMGVIELSPEGSKEISFNFRSQIVTSIQDIEARTFKDLAEYASALVTPINTRLADARRSSIISPYPVLPSHTSEPGHTIARLFLDGYYEGKPSRVDVRFFHEDQTLSNPEIEARNLDWMSPSVFGPDTLLDLIFNKEDERFARYRKTWDGTLPGAVEVCKNHILAFSGPEALEVDSEASSGVGGHIHIATITPAAGFAWVIPPINR